LLPSCILLLYMLVTSLSANGRSIAISVSVCLFVCLSVCPLAYLKNHTFKYHLIFSVHVTGDGCMARFSFVRLSARYLTIRCRITKLDIEMFHHESRKSIYYGVKMSKVKVTRHKNIAGVGLCTFVSAGFFWFIPCFSCV